MILCVSDASSLVFVIFKSGYYLCVELESCAVLMLCLSFLKLRLSLYMKLNIFESKGFFLFHLFFFSGLSKRTTSEGLRTAFAQFGEVADGNIKLPLL